MKCKKVEYRTRRQAWKWSHYFFKTLGTMAGPYKCKNCGRYHLSRTVIGPFPKYIQAVDNKLDKLEKSK